MEVFRERGVTACTDVTGFGLAGHLLEMLHACNLSARLNLDALPLYDGADAVYYQASIKSTLHDGNRQAAQSVQESMHRNFPFLFDPQTSGGLLAAVEASQVESTLIALKANGYADAACIGSISIRRETISANRDSFASKTMISKAVRDLLLQQKING